MTHSRVGALHGDLDQPRNQSASGLAATVSPGLWIRNLRGSGGQGGCAQIYA
jgi:hypothetical protein